MKHINTRWMMTLLAVAAVLGGTALAGDEHKGAKEAALAKMNFKPVPATPAQVAAMKKLSAKECTVPTLAMKMNLIPAGSFMMGSPKSWLRALDFCKKPNPRWSATAKVTDDQRLPNAWGLYDMHGNVAEWCLDSRNPYSTTSVADPVAFDESNEKIVRGGGIGFTYRFMRSASRYSVPHAANYYNCVGMRVVLAPKVKLAAMPIKPLTKEVKKRR